MRVLSIVLLLVAFAVSAASAGRWDAVVLRDGITKLQGVRCGELIPSRPGIEAVGATNIGEVFVAGVDSELRPWCDTVLRYGQSLTGIFIGDIDPTLAGNELYVGGGTGQPKEGVVLQIHFDGNAWNTKNVWRGSGVVHAFSALPPETNGGSARLVVPTYSGVIHALHCASTGEWSIADILIIDSTIVGGGDALLFKDVVAFPMQGRTMIAASTKGGQAIISDLESPSDFTISHVQPNGIARLSADENGTVYAACNDGAAIRMRFHTQRWHTDTLYRDIDQLRGVAYGRFRFANSACPVAIFGYSGFVRLLFDGGVGWDTHTIFQDSEKAHWMFAAEMISENDSDELLIGGYSGKLILLFWKE